MFAGIVEDAGKVLSLEERPEAWLLRLALSFADNDGLEAGSSLSVNGCCLTLRENSDGKEASFDLLEETMDRTNLSGLTEGSLVNLERSLPANGRVGGHFVTGHVDALGEIEVFEERGKNLYLQIKVPSDCVRYLVDKGCIAVDGCSLTVCDVKGDSFAIWLIPHTLVKTNLTGRKPGDLLNIEFDLLAKYVEKLTMSSLENRGT
jgi:riboflavin synthase